MSEDPNRWEDVYRNKKEAETSWHEARPQVSLDLIAETGARRDAAIVDVGGGSSRLVDCLLEQGFRRITVLDLSETALAKARARLPQDAPVEWVVENVLHWHPSARFDVWHDRAAFHFLTERADQNTYLKVMDRALVPGGHAIIGTFALDGPTLCSGLPVDRYDGALDKTGTLTEGRPTLTDLETTNGREEVLALVGSVEVRSEHPIARAIVEAAEVDGLTLSNLSRFDSVTDRGGYLGTWRKKCN